MRVRTLVVAVALAAVLGSAGLRARGEEKPSVRTGIEGLLESRLSMLEGRRVGIITNPTGVLPDLTHDLDALVRAGVKVVAAFGPEHGVRGSLQAGEEDTEVTVDPRTGVRVFPLYGKNREAIAATFREAGVDVVLYDIQDAGSRCYTYVWTMSDAMEAAAILGLPMVVLDRPNPIGGVAVEGPVLEPRFASFVGRYPIALRHGMTVGELALLFNERFVPAATGGRRVPLTVVPMEGWRRSMYFDQTGLPWVMPSPNMPTLETALVYPGQVLFEGTSLSEGRGTARPFELFGAPFVAASRLVDRLNALGLPGVRFREAYFTPTFSKFQGENVAGFQVHVTDRERYRPVETAVAALAILRLETAGRFEWRASGSGTSRRYFIDLLAGTDRVRTMLDAGKETAEIVASWQPALADFQRLRERYLLYRD